MRRHALLAIAVLAACEYQEVPDARRGRGETLPPPPEISTAVLPGPTLPAPPAPAASPPPVVADQDDPGPPPVGCSITKDAAGFFRRSSGKSEYVGYVPKSYTGAPSALLVGLHGCGDDAYNFATWGVAPYDTRGAQTWIGISVEDTSGGGHCWSQTDDDLVLAAIDDIAKCFYVHRHRVVVGGFSSGGELAYGVGLRHASRFAGILVECATSSAAGNPSTLAAGASWKIPVAHLAHVSDSVFPIATVRADWSVLEKGGLPVATRETAGDHDGQWTDWAYWLLPQMKSWRSP